MHRPRGFTLIGYFAGADSGEVWTKTLGPYYQDSDLLRCPSAARPAFPEGAANPWGGKFSAWGVFDGTFAMLGLEGVFGSYGMNGYAAKPAPEVPANSWGYDTKNNWPGPNVKGAHYVPLFLDCAYLGGFPSSKDQPPLRDGEILGRGPQGSGDEIRRFCLLRHGTGVNGLFLDFSVREIDLKELWKLKWHKEFDTNGQWTLAGGMTAEGWAALGDGWLAKYKNY
jgi:prepilin-type processing-associated H-X9-DG protein